MAGVESVLCAKKTIDKGVLIKICPITSGCPTRMLEAEAVRRCAANQKMAADQKSKRTAGGTRLSLRPGKWCLVCRGKQWPAELEIIDPMEVEAMAVKRHKGTCERCGNSGVVIGKNYRKMMCTSCNMVYASVNNRLPVVVAAVVELGKVGEFMGLVGEGLPEQVGNAVESVVLARIAEAVGYAGTDVDGLVAAVTALAQRANDDSPVPDISTVQADRDRAVDLLRAANAAMPDGMMDYEQLPARISGLASDYNALLVEWRVRAVPPADVLRALDLVAGTPISAAWEAAVKIAAQLEAAERELMANGEIAVTAWPADVLKALFGDRPDWVESLDADCTAMAILQTCAQLEAVERELHTVLDESLDNRLALANLRSALDLDEASDDIVTAVAELAQWCEHYRQQYERLTMELSVSTDQLAEAERTRAWTDQQVEMIREALHQPGLPVGEIAMHCQALRASVGTCPPLAGSLAVRPLDGYLLDLALDMLTGKVTGVDPDFVATMREAA